MFVMLEGCEGYHREAQCPKFILYCYVLPCQAIEPVLVSISYIFRLKTILALYFLHSVMVTIELDEWLCCDWKPFIYYLVDSEDA